MDPKEYFYAHDGKVIRDLKELLVALEVMSDATFKHHVNEQKNDFANWVDDVIQNHDLAAVMRKIRSRIVTIEAVRDSVDVKAPRPVPEGKDGYFGALARKLRITKHKDLPPDMLREMKSHWE